jgi:hypothetical protein
LGSEVQQLPQTIHALRRQLKRRTACAPTEKVADSVNKKSGRKKLPAKWTKTERFSTEDPFILTAQRKNPRLNYQPGVYLGNNSLTMTYFHTGIRTIIGAESFHCPVRDGKEWYQLAMVIRRNLLTCCSDVEQHVEFIEQISFNLDYRTVLGTASFECVNLA